MQLTISAGRMDEAAQRSVVEIQPHEIKLAQVTSCDTLFCQKSFNTLFSIVAMGLWSNIVVNNTETDNWTAILCYASY